MTRYRLAENQQVIRTISNQCYLVRNHHMTTWNFVPSFFSNLWVFCTVYTIDLSIVIKRRLPKVVSTKLTDKDYELCQRIARDYYIKGNIIRTPSVSELARLALELIFTTRRPSPIVVIS
jgi:hypothetical protein